MPKVRGLTPKQARFVDEYLVDLNAAAAARRAGYSTHRSEVLGYELLTKPDIQAAIQAARQRLQERVEITVDTVVRKLAELGDYDGEGWSHAARVRAWELLGKHVGPMFADRVDAVTRIVVEHVYEGRHEPDR